MTTPLSEQSTPPPDDILAEARRARSPQELAAGQAESEEWNSLFSKMDEARASMGVLTPDRIRTLAIVLCAVMGLAVFIMLLSGSSGAPWILFGGAVLTVLAVTIHCVSDAQSRVALPASVTLGVVGILGLLTGSVIEAPEAKPVDHSGPTLIEREMQKDFDSMAVRIENRHHVPVTENWRPAEQARAERYDVQGPQREPIRYDLMDNE
jgi:hypothetical protein